MLSAKKTLGQNFLKNNQTIKLMVDSLDVQSNDFVIEIGPGLGAVTNVVLQKIDSVSGKLLCIELDNRVIPILQSKFGSNPKFSILNENILDWLPTFNPAHPYKIIGSLPYYITSPIIHAVIKKQTPPDVCVFLIQKEVGKKISETIPESSYLSTFIQTFYKVEYLETVDKKYFDPVPKVDGAVVKLEKLQNPLIKFDAIKKYEGFLHKGYSNPRKMLNKVFDKDLLEKIGIDPTLRPQNLDVDTWVRLFRG